MSSYSEKSDAKPWDPKYTKIKSPGKRGDELYRPTHRVDVRRHLEGDDNWYGRVAHGMGTRSMCSNRHVYHKRRDLSKLTGRQHECKRESEVCKPRDNVCLL